MPFQGSSSETPSAGWISSRTALIWTETDGPSENFVRLMQLLELPAD
jgi:hypothetical protein